MTLLIVCAGWIGGALLLGVGIGKWLKRRQRQTVDSTLDRMRALVPPRPEREQATSWRVVK